ncbi:MAG: TIGR03943 family protein [Leptolyngbya sp. SIO4C1]|nr:TIGR03943 family protein [Leptolyngbya sp. SIO4C1]
MSANAPRKRRFSVLSRDALDILALAAWGAMLLKYWLTGKLYVLLHPDYMWLSNTAGLVLLLLAAFKLLQLMVKLKQPALVESTAAHFTLLPAKWSSGLLLAVAVFGLVYTPQAFASDTALQRGVSETLTLTRSQPQQFGRQTQPEDRTIIDWVRTLNVYPEPDAYTGDAVKVEGFVIHPEDWPATYLMISRFVLTCCAADAYPVGLPVKVTTRAAYPVDSWLEISGEMVTETLSGRRQLVIDPTQLTTIPEPRNPYEY